ncbi:kinase-like domain-containing protein [Gamsiella multidivaricata]|uniref:kinase-like domain-containing protein n=1 Tax=Gamsiella multidivaricata TaxID=101098 RepID=UPI002220A458|nr:kinase-like domain-containing protein [Gamsiella multidivaricata]KAI7818062.1 kinase-like domain-containing protein [Gamsiella multidivaricata]
MGNGTSRDQDDFFNNEVNLLQFHMLRVVGKGSFGKVRMVKRRETGKMYALKYISKEQVIKMDAVRNIIRERQILESVDHAFVVNMRFAFQDDEYMYMCMDLMMGGDLRFHMNRRSFGEDVVRFWIAEISSAVNHLHTLGIVHRDIKPDNILLDEKGHAHITDFNISCKLTPEKPVLTSQSGTMAYMAPEVFKGTGYGTSVDWWALGVIFYECIYNQRPFLTESVGELKRAIPNQTIEYPAKDGISRECVMTIQGFLTRDPTERLGSKGGMDGIRYQPFFKTAAHETQISPEQWWYLLETKQLIPKFQPPSEAANFDATYDLEELLLDEDPLTYRSTRKRAERLQKERDQAIKEENARLKAEHEAAVMAALAAEAAMEEMNKKLEESMRKIRISSSSTRSAAPAQQDSATAVSKRKSRLQLFGGDNNDSGGDGQPMVQTQPPPIPQPQPQNHHTLSQLARQTQFQSIPLSPIDSTGAHSEFPIPPVPSLRFPSSPPKEDYRWPLRDQSPLHTAQDRQGPSLSRPLDSSPPPEHHPSSYYHRPTNPSRPPLPTSVLTQEANGSTVNGYTYSASADATGGASVPGVTAVYLSKPTVPPSRVPAKKRYDEENADQANYQGEESGQSTRDIVPLSATIRRQPSQEHVIVHQNQHPFQAAHPQMAITSPVIIPTPLDHSISRQKHIPTQQPQPQPVLRHQTSQQMLRRPTAPTPAPALNIAAAAAEMAGMSEKGKFEYQMELIDREFTTFDYTVYESYHGLVDPVTMSVGNPPEWVRSRD